MKQGACATLAVIVVTLATACSAPVKQGAGASANIFSNPVISGFAPDPSIVRVGEDFYLVNSSFEYFPGIPVYHSRDLVTWKLLSYALHDPAHADLATIGSSGGIHASTIRYHDGVFYVITTNVIEARKVNFILTAKDPRGPWTGPHVLENAPGIDPSLFFDDDGRVWYVGNWIPPDPEFPGQAEIWLQEVDIDNMRLMGERHYLWRGCCQGTWAEGPHIYKRDGYYYLLISEGGTSFEHALSVAISNQITGPYANNPRNPVLTHRHLSYDYPISGIGHADLVELADGRWYAVALGWRLVDGRHGILGRETFLLPVIWETEPHLWKNLRLTFPVFSPATGRVDLHFPLPFPGSKQRSPTGFLDEFDQPELSLEWNFRRTPAETFWDLASEPGTLRLELQPGHIAEGTRYSFVGIRQRNFQFEAVTRMRFDPETAGEEAGITLIQNDRSAIVMSVSKVEATGEVSVYRLLDGSRETLARRAIGSGPVLMKVTGDYLRYGFYFSADGESWHPVVEDLDGTSLSPAVIPGYNYTGVYIGLFASANGKQSDSYVDYEYFLYSPAMSERDDWFNRQTAHESKD